MENKHVYKFQSDIHGTNDCQFKANYHNVEGKTFVDSWRRTKK